MDRQVPDFKEFKLNESLDDSNEDIPKMKVNNADPKSFSSRDIVKSNYTGITFYKIL